MSDETKAGIVCLTWEVFLFIGLFRGDDKGIVIAILATMITATIFYLDMVRENALAKRRRQRYRDYIRLNFIREMSELERSDRDDDRREL